MLEICYIFGWFLAEYTHIQVCQKSTFGLYKCLKIGGLKEYMSSFYTKAKTKFLKIWPLGETKKNSRFPGPRAPKNPSPRFFFFGWPDPRVTRVRTRFSCPQHSTDHASRKASVMPVFSTCTSKKNTWRSWEKPYLEEGVDILQGVDILWLLALNLCMQSSIKFSKKKRKNSPARTNSRQWLPGNLEFFLVSP